MSSTLSGITSSLSSHSSYYRDNPYVKSKYDGIKLGKSALLRLAEGINNEKGKWFGGSSPKSALLARFIGDIGQIGQSRRPLQATASSRQLPISPIERAVVMVANLRNRLKGEARPLLETAITADGSGNFTYKATVNGKSFIEVSGIPADSPHLAWALANELTDRTTEALLSHLSMNGTLDKGGIRDTIWDQLRQDIPAGKLEHSNAALRGLKQGEWIQTHNGADRVISWKEQGTPKLTHADGAFTLAGKEIMRSAWPAAETANGQTRSASGSDSSLVSLSLTSRSNSGSETATTLPLSSRDGSLTPVSVSGFGSDDAIGSDDEAPPPPPPLTDPGSDIGNDLVEVDDGVPPPPPYDVSTERLLGMLARIHGGQDPGRDRNSLLAEIGKLKADYEREAAANGSDAADHLFEARFEALFELVNTNDIKLPKDIIDPLNALWAPVAPPLTASRHAA